MARKRDIVDRMRIASACPTSWDRMSGDDRTRFCDLCGLSVYNISEMTSRDVEKLFAGTQGRICARLYKRTDGTVLTKDCPVGVRAIRRRLSRVAGACITAIFSFCLSVMGQRVAQEESCPSNGKVTISRRDAVRSKMLGLIRDPNGAVIAGATVILVNPRTKSKFETTSNEDGLFQFPNLEVGIYELQVISAGFATLELNKIEIEPNQMVNIDLDLNVDAGSSVTVGIVGEDPLLESNNSNLTTVFSPKQITKLPF